MFDVLQRVVDRKDYILQTTSVPRKRIFNIIDKKIIDTYATAQEWVANSEDYLFTDPVINSKDVLFSLRESPIQFDSIDNLIGKNIGIHLGYIYPQLDPYFEDGRINTSVAKSDFSMLKMTLLKRNDASIVTNVVGLWIIKNNPIFQGKFVLSDTAIDSVGYRFVFTKDRQPFIDIFNKELKLMIDSGEISEIIAKYKY